ncbi:MAG: hypothetical protein AAF902_02370 [Chloroflexota bacterium]
MNWILILFRLMSVAIVISTVVRYGIAVRRDNMIQVGGNSARFFIQLVLISFLFSF